MDRIGFPSSGPPGLLAKYEALVALRLAAAQDRDAPRAHLQALARRFPGALRELDRRTLTDLQGRVEDLRRAVAGRAPLPRWVAAQLGYHGFICAALRLRPLLRMPQADPQVVLRDYRPIGDEPPASALGLPWLAQIARPAGGRLNPVAFAFVAARLGLTPERIEQLVFF